MSHRGDEKGKGDRGKRGSAHVHNYVTVRSVPMVVKGKKVTYKFQKCNQPGCRNPDNLVIE